MVSGTQRALIKGRAGLRQQTELRVCDYGPRSQRSAGRPRVIPACSSARGGGGLSPAPSRGCRRGAASREPRAADPQPPCRVGGCASRPSPTPRARASGIPCPRAGASGSPPPPLQPWPPHPRHPGDFSGPGIQPIHVSTSPALAGRFFTTSATWEAPNLKLEDE